MNDLLYPAAAVDGVVSSKSGNRTSTTLAAYTGAWTKKQVVHLLKRTMFGARRSDIDYFLTKTMSQAVDELLTPGNAPSPPLNNYSNQYTDTVVAAGATWVNDFSTQPMAVSHRQQSIKAWWWNLMATQNRSAEQKMVLFWHNHLATQLSMYMRAEAGYKYLETLRQHAFGNFKQLMKAITLDPAMLRFLNGDSNTKNAPDENYGRELQELFTVGKDLPNHFTEDDVKAAARVLTGYRIDPSTFTSYFDSTKHDTTDKQFSAFYNNTLITGRTGAAGANELDDLLTMIFAQDEVAKYICRKIYRFFVYYDIDASVEANIIEPLAVVFRNSNYDIAATLSTLFKSEHFFDALNYGCMIKSPVDFLVGLVREMEVALPGNTNLPLQYRTWMTAEYFCMTLSQDLLDPPSVSGWTEYYQYPQYHELWINSSTLPFRNQVSDLLLYTGFSVSFNGGQFQLIIDVLAYAAGFSNPGDPVALIDDIVAHLYMIDVSQSAKDYMRIYGLLGGQTSNTYWSTAWTDYINNPTDAVKKNVVQTRLQYVLKYLMDSSEYQLS
ncbi:MAG: DUF1800 domain-containing protein [Chitinophagales bacterium]